MPVPAASDSTALLGGRLAGAPISWGVCEVPDWGYLLEVDTVLGEMASLGLRSTELGPPGFLSDDPDELRATLGRHGLELVGGFLAVVLHDAAAHDAAVTQARATCAQLAAAGGEVLVLAAATGLEGYDARPELDADEWARLVATAAEIAGIATEQGLRTCLHPHVGTHVEQAAEVRRFLADSDLPLCLDTGHLLIGGVDPLVLVQEFADRISHVHLKDVDASVADRVRSGELTYMEGVQLRMYVPLGAGDARIAEVVETLEAAGYAGWYVLEQDTSLPDGTEASASMPLSDTAQGLDFLASEVGSDLSSTSS